MINLSLTVREALWILSKCEVYDSTYDKVVNAFEKAMGVNQNRSVTITGGMSLDNRISCIKAIRLHSGWSLKESKEWTDVLVGGWKYDTYYPAEKGTRHTITLKTSEAAENLLRDLTTLGCEGFLS